MHSFFRIGPPFGQTLLSRGCCAFVGLMLVAGMAVAQTGGDQPAGNPPGGTQRGVGEVGPEIFYLEGDGGRLVPVPGFRYRDFVELFRMQAGLPGAVQPPAAVLESLVVRVDTRPEQAADQKTAPERGECPVVVECTVRQTRGGWVHVPIDLDGLVLSGAAEHDGPGRLVVDTEAVTAGPGAAGAGRRGYRLWFDAALPATGDARHTVVLPGRVATETDAGGLTLSLRLPAATTSLVAVATMADGVVTVAPPPHPERLSDTDGPGGPQTEIAGLIGAVRIRVAARNAPALPQATVPQAAVESLVRIDGHNVFTDATIRLENLPAAMTRMRITLPPRTSLRNVRGAATVAARGGTIERPTIDVTIDRATEPATMIELECERPIDPSDREPIELVGFAVADVPLWRQWGRVSLVVEGDWRAEWPAEPGVRRVDPPPAARRPGFVAAFAYDAQPASLPLVVRPRPSRVVIEPDYRYHLGAQRLGMVARFRMSVRGAPVTSLVVEQADLAGVGPAAGLADESGWVVEDVGPATLVDSAAVKVAAGRIIIPFLQALGGEAVIELRGSRRLARDSDEVAWSLPAPSADLVVPATVVITADSDLEILPDVARSRGLVRQAATGFPRSEADVESGGLLYRLDAPNGRFVGSRRSLPRRIDGTLAVQVDIDETEFAVEQLLRLTVVHVPLDAVELLVPEDVAASGTLEVRQDDIVLEPLEDRRSAEGLATAEKTGSRMFRVFPPDPILGRGDLVVRYRLPAPTIRPESTEARLLPFVLPANARIDRQTLVVEAAESLSVDVPDEAWRRDVGPGERSRAWVAAKRQDGVRLAIATRPRVASGGTIVEAAWLQTHLLVDRREDLCNYVLAGAGERLVVTVPGGFGDPAARTCDILLDGAPRPVAVTADGGFTSELPRITGGRRRRLEIRLSSPRAVTAAERWAAALRLPAPVRLAAPVFGGRAVERRFYWEIMARADEHLLARPGTWTSQQRWTWDSAGFTAVPVVTTTALADWLHQAVVRSPGQTSAPEQATAATTVVAPPLVERRSVYSGMGNPGDHRLWLVPSWCLVFCCSGVTLAVGLALAYVPALRRAGAVVPVAAAIVLTAVATPGLAPLVAQAAVPGTLLVLLAWFLRATFDRGEPGIDIRPDEVAVSASTLTRELSGSPAVVVTQSSVARERTTGTSVGSGS